MDHADTCGPAEVEKVTQAFGQWQPIETAPKGEDVLIAGGTYYYTGELFQTERSFDSVKVGRFHRYAWFGGYGSEYDEEYVHAPTHWMPLPTAPGSDDRTVIQNSSVNQTSSSPDTSPDADNGLRSAQAGSGGGNEATATCGAAVENDAVEARAPRRLCDTSPTAVGDEVEELATIAQALHEYHCQSNHWGLKPLADLPVDEYRLNIEAAARAVLSHLAKSKGRK